MRLHVLGLPHTMTSRRYNVCAFTSLVRQFSTMMTREGYDVVLYAGDENEAECAELVPVTSRANQEAILGDFEWFQRGEVYGVDWDERTLLWTDFINNCITAMRDRVRPGDIVCLPGGAGWTMRRAIDAIPAGIFVEPYVGSIGIGAPYRVFPSYAFMQRVYTAKMGDDADGHFTDAVIPHWVEPTELGDGAGDYVLFLSRMTPRKGYGIAIEATAEAGVPLLIAGVGGDRPEADHVHYMGFADEAMRTTLLQNARALMCPSLYLEPFGLVVAEAMMCGTPVITTDWGAFPELVLQGVDGFRCRTPEEFTHAILDAPSLNRAVIRQRALARFSPAVIAPQYTAYFDRLRDVHGSPEAP